VEDNSSGIGLGRVVEEPRGRDPHDIRQDRHRYGAEHNDQSQPPSSRSQEHGHSRRQGKEGHEHAEAIARFDHADTDVVEQDDVSFRHRRRTQCLQGVGAHVCGHALQRAP
jgi:hypothetical protein